MTLMNQTIEKVITLSPDSIRAYAVANYATNPHDAQNSSSYELFMRLMELAGEKETGTSPDAIRSMAMGVFLSGRMDASAHAEFAKQLNVADMLALAVEANR